MNRLLHLTRPVFAALLALAMSVSPFVPSAAHAAGAPWMATVGAENKDQGVQLAYYFPDDITVNAGDTIQFNFATAEPHSVNFGPPGPPDFTKLRVKGDSVQFTFDTPGDYAFHCDLHEFMTGVVHVQPSGSAYPYSQPAYDQRALVRQNQLMAEGLALLASGRAAAAQASGVTNITAGTGVKDGPGSIFILRFLRDKLTVKVGDTVTWSNLDPEAPHTITLNEAYTDQFQSLVPDGLDAYFNGTSPGHATIDSPAKPVNSGFLWAMPFPGLPSQGTQFTATFTSPGLYRYYCELHDDLGMTGTIQVVPK